MTSPNYSLLSQYFGQPTGASSGASAADIAKMIAISAKRKAPPPKQSSNEPSLIGRFFDLLSRPNYAAAEFVREWQETGTPDLSAAWEGFSGKKKTTFSKVLEEGGMESPFLRGSLGFILDVGLDPLTYVGGAGLAKATSKLPGNARALPNTPQSGQRVQRIEPVMGNVPPAFQRPSNTPLPQIDLNGLLRSGGLRAPNVRPPIRDAGPNPPVVPPMLQRPFSPDDIRTAAPEAQIMQAQGPGPIPGKFVRKLEGPESQGKASDIEEILDPALRDRAMGTGLASTRPNVPTLSVREQTAAREILESTKNTRFLGRDAQIRLFNRSMDAVRKQSKKGKDFASPRALQQALNVYKALESSLVARNAGPLDNIRLSEVIEEAGGPHMIPDVLNEFRKSAPDLSTPAGMAIARVRSRVAANESQTVKAIVDRVAESNTFIKSARLTSDAQNLKIEKVIKDAVKKGIPSVEKLAKSPVNFALTKNADDLIAAGKSKVSEDVARMGGVQNAIRQAMQPDLPKGLSKSAAQVTNSLVNAALLSSKSAAQIANQNMLKNLEEVMATGKRYTEQVRAETIALEKDLGKMLPREALGENRISEFIMGRVATWWGQADLRPTTLQAISSAMATARARGNALSTMFSKVPNPDQQKLAFQIAQGRGAVAGRPEVAALGDEIKRMMDNLIGHENSVVLRSGVDLENLNKWMRYYKVGMDFAQSKKPIRTSTGTTVDVSGKRWTEKWKTFDPVEGPEAFLFKLQQAVEMATREKAVFDQFAAQFGSPKFGKGYTSKIKGYSYLDGFYFPPEIAKQLPRAVKDWHPQSWSTGSPLLKHYDRVLSMWKAGVTIYRPGHHIRNMIGDIYLGWMDGVNSLRPYQLAAKVQRVGNTYKDMIDVDRLVEIGALGPAYKSAGSGEVIFRNRSGVGFTADQIYAVAHQRGLLEHTQTLEDIIDMGSQGVKRSPLDIKPFGGRVQAVARGATELQSHNARLAHFIDKVQKSHGSDLSKIFNDAANRARKWHPSGIDLTDFEKKVLRRTIPFYTWIRKSTPLILEGLMMNPGKALIPIKALDAGQEMAGIETPGRHDPFPVDQMFPEWLRDQGLGPISPSDGILGDFTNQTPPGYNVFGLGLNPLSELIAQISNPGRTISSSITPAVQLPMELITGRETFTGAPILGDQARPGAFQEWVGKNIPIVSAAQGLTGFTPFGTQTNAAEKSNTATKEAFVNWLTGLGIKGTGPYIRQGVYERREGARGERAALREEFLLELKRRLENGATP